MNGSMNPPTVTFRNGLTGRCPATVTGNVTVELLDRLAEGRLADGRIAPVPRLRPVPHLVSESVRSRLHIARGLTVAHRRAGPSLHGCSRQGRASRGRALGRR